MKKCSLVDIYQPLGVTFHLFFRVEEFANIYQTARPYIPVVRTSDLIVYAKFISSLFYFHSYFVFVSARNICSRYGLCRLPYYGGWRRHQIYSGAVWRRPGAFPTICSRHPAWHTSYKSMRSRHRVSHMRTDSSRSGTCTTSALDSCRYPIRIQT